MKRETVPVEDEAARRVFVTGEWGRTRAIEQQIWRSAPHTLVRSFPNYDAHDLLRGEARTPDDFSFPAEGDEWGALFRHMDDAIEGFAPDLIITCFISDALNGRMQERWGTRIPTFCVPQAAARLEEDRSFARQVAERCGVRTSRAREFATGAAALVAMEKSDFLSAATGLVVKFAGARLDGVYAELYDTLAETRAAIARRPAAHFPIVVERRMPGVEIAFACLVDARREVIVPMVTDFEYTRLCAGDVGCETSEMGIHDVAGVAARPLDEIVRPLMPWFKEVGYVGWFDTSCIYDPQEDTLTAFEFMTRLGSSQTENVMAMLGGLSFADVLKKFLAGKPIRGSGADMFFRRKHAVSTVVVASGHPAPGAGQDGVPIAPDPSLARTFVRGWREGLHDDDLALLSRMESVVTADGVLRTKGQRHFCATGAAATYARAKELSLFVAKTCTFRGAQYRIDIGHRWEDLALRARLGEAGLLPEGWSRS